MNKHTSGPWKVVRDPIRSEYRVFDSAHGIVAIVFKQADCDGKHYEMDAEEHSANASLVASAPELLAALKNLVAKVQDMTDDMGLGQELEAIEKAEGRR